MKEKFRRGDLGVKYVKGLVGVFLLIVGFALTLYTGLNYFKELPKNPVHSAIMLLSDVLLALIVLELAKTVFTYLENDEAYLHSILQTAFIAVLREVILLEVRGVTLEKGITLSLLILIIGYVYYKLYGERRWSEKLKITEEPVEELIGGRAEAGRRDGTGR